MYRLDGVIDRVEALTVEAENSINEYEESREELHIESMIELFKNFKQKETQLKIQRFINISNTDLSKLEDLAWIFKIIDIHLNEEKQRQENGIATHLLAILMNNLQNSPQLWGKLIRMVGCRSSSTPAIGVNLFLKQKYVMKRIADVIEEYLKTLCQVGDDFFIDQESTVDEKKLKLFKSINVAHMIFFIHHLLNQQETSQFFANKIFCTFELSSEFIFFLKRSLRNLNL